MTESMGKEDPAPSTTQKALTATLFIVLATIGFANIVIGFVKLDNCGNAMALPALLLVNGALWMIPIYILVVLNFGSTQEDDVKCLLCFLEKLFFFFVLFLLPCTIYVLVSATQVKTLDFLCASTWLPPYTLCVVIADWVCFAVLIRCFCVHEVSPEKPAVEFKHLKNLPPLALSWNRHRVLRTY